MMRTDGIPVHIVERLIILAEECAEVQQDIFKILRFGVDTVHLKEPLLTNRDKLTDELGDLQCMIDEIVATGLCNRDEISIAAQIKRNKLKRWAQWNNDGTPNLENNE